MTSFFKEKIAVPLTPTHLPANPRLSRSWRCKDPKQQELVVSLNRNKNSPISGNEARRLSQEAILCRLHRTHPTASKIKLLKYRALQLCFLKKERSVWLSCLILLSLSSCSNMRRSFDSSLVSCLLLPCLSCYVISIHTLKMNSVKDLICYK